MRFLYLFCMLFLVFAGVANIIQSVRDSVASGSEKLVEVTVKKKVVDEFGIKELKVSYDNKDYWVKVTQQKFSNSNPNRPVTLKYNVKKDLILDNDATKKNLVPGMLLLCAATFIFVFGVRRPTKI